MQVYAILKELAALRSFGIASTLPPTSIVASWEGNQAKSRKEISLVFIGVLVRWRGFGGLTREFWAVFGEIIFGAYMLWQRRAGAVVGWVGQFRWCWRFRGPSAAALAKCCESLRSG